LRLDVPGEPPTMRRGSHTRLFFGLTLLWVGTGCSTTPLAKPPPGVPSGVYGVNIEEETGPEDPKFLNRVEGLTHFLTSRSFEFRGKPDGSIKHLEAAAKADPSQETVVVQAARRFLQRKKTDKAIEILRLAQATNPESETTHEWLGLAYQQASQPDEAIAAFGIALAKSNPTLISVRGLSKLHAAANRFDDAFKVLDTALTKDKREPEFWLGIADLYRDTGIAARAKMDRIKAGIITSLNKASALKPESPLVLNRLADYYKVWGESEKAIALFIQLIELNPSLIGVREQLADLYLRADKTENATRQLEAILRERPTNERALFVLGGIKRQLDKLDEAAAHFETVLKINPKFELAYYELAGVRLFQNKPDITLATLKKAGEQFKPRFITKFYAGLAHSSLHQYPKAIENLLDAEELAQAGEQNRLTHFFYFQLGAAYERNRQYETANDTFNKAIEMSPDYHNAMNYLGYMWADINRNLDEAAKHITKANELSPDNASYVDSLGWLYFRQGKYTEALAELQRAAELMKDEPDSTIHEHIGDTHQQLGQAHEARAQWEKSLGLLREQEKKMTTPDAYLLEQLGNVLNKLGQADKANAAWQRSYDITPNQPLHKKLHPAKKEE
jgi:tetratricopeptide (TPR) repeat protein